MSGVYVGQIYNSDDGIYVVTQISTSSIGREIASIVYNNGASNYWSCDYIEHTGKLLAEYGTWQQAVNSPKFRGEK